MAAKPAAAATVIYGEVGGDRPPRGGGGIYRAAVEALRLATVSDSR